MEVHCDIWLDKDGKAFGEKCFRILEAVEATGSISRATAELNLSYVGVLNILETCEERLGFALLERKKGGSSGGGSRLTPRARALMKGYKSFNEELLESITHIRGKHFGWME
jgi:molybdate transport system regulatory protein